MRGFLSFRIALAAFALVPVLAGGAGAVLGEAFPGFGAAGNVDLDSHFRYLSGLLLGIGAAFFFCAVNVTALKRLFPALAMIVILGGLARFASMIEFGPPSKWHLFGLVMELGVTPLMLVLHQYFQGYPNDNLLANETRAIPHARRHSDGHQTHLPHSSTGHH